MYILLLLRSELQASSYYIRYVTTFHENKKDCAYSVAYFHLFGTLEKTFIKALPLYPYLCRLCVTPKLNQCFRPNILKNMFT